MRTFLSIWATSAVALLAGGCDTSNNTQLIFGQTHKVGLSISASAPQQGGSISLGYEDLDIAIMPLVTPGDHSRLATATKDCKFANEGAGDSGAASEKVPKVCTEDAASVFGYFGLSGKTENASPGFELGKFFATGFAAQTVADGFREKLKK